MNNTKNIIVIPVDNRPVSYTFPDSIGLLNTKTNTILPPREYMGGLNAPASTKKLFDWLEKVTAATKIDFIICALDTIAYGGLIPSRWREDSQEIVLTRLQKFRNIIEQADCKVFAFSSIMRISNNNINEEEKPYWDEYGKLIFEYSSLTHKFALNPSNFDAQQRLITVKNQIPRYIIEDYLKTRHRNFSVNKTYLKWLEERVLDFLVFGKDDTATLGINVQEAEQLSSEIKGKNLEEKAVIHTGSDEIISMLIARSATQLFNREITIFPMYSTPHGAEVIPCYEDKPLYESMKTHFKTCGIKTAQSEEQADMLLLLHTPEENQNDIILQEFTEPENIDAIDFCIQNIKNAQKPLILADVYNANGGDNLLVEKIFSELTDLQKLYGYAGWNTAANSIGSALSIGICAYIAEKQNNFSLENFNRLMFIRFADDWAYQSVARQKIRAASEIADEVVLYKELIPLLEKIAPKFGVNPDKIIASFPWGRTFEVEINFLNQIYN